MDAATFSSRSSNDDDDDRDDRDDIHVARSRPNTQHPSSDPAERVRALRAAAQLLKDLPKEVERPVMIPLGASAFIPGKIRRTNEVFVKLDQHYLKTSAFHARRSIARRVLRLEAQHSLPPSRPHPLDHHHHHQKHINEEESVAPSTNTGDSNTSSTAPRGSTAAAPDLPPGVAESTVVHRSDDGTVHILEFPSSEDEVTLENKQQQQQQQQQQYQKGDSFRSATDAFPSLPHDTVQKAEDPGPDRAPPSQIHHNADGTVTIVEFPDAVPGQQSDHSVQRSNLDGAASTLSPDCDLPTLEHQVSNLRLQGNSAFQKKDFEAAIQYYTQCIELISSSNQPPGLRRQLHMLLANRAASFTAVKKFSAAIADATQAIVERPEYTKAYHRLAQAQMGQGRLESAALTYEKAVAMDPNNASLKKFLAKVLQAMQKEQICEAADEAQREADSDEQRSLPMQPSPIQERQTLDEDIHAPAPEVVPKRRSLFAQRMRSHT